MTDPNADEMAYEVLHTQNSSSSGSFESNEYSLLHEVSSGNIPNGTLNHINGDFNLTNMQSSFASAVSDKSVEEVQLHLVELIDENQSLKEALTKNNSMMKEQMTTIAAWREHMILSRKQQQHNLEKIKVKITDLEKENNELKENIAIFEKTSKCSDEIDISKKTSDNAANNSHEESHPVFKNDSKTCDNFIDEVLQHTVVLSHHMNNIVDKRQVPEILSEVDKCRKELTTLKKLIEKKREINEIDGDYCTIINTEEESDYAVIQRKSFKDEVETTLLHNSEVQAEIECLQETIEKQKKEIGCLRMQQQELMEEFKAHEIKFQNNEMSLKAHIDAMNSELNHKVSLIEKYKGRCENLQQQIDKYQTKLERPKVSDNSTVQDLYEQIENLQEILKLEQQQKDKDLKEMMEKCEKLQVDYDRAAELLGIESKARKKECEELSALKENDAKIYLEQIDHLTAQIYDFEQKLYDKHEEIENLTKELSALKEESENIPVLKSQIGVYKIDLQEANTSRDAALAQVDMLTKELKKYKRQSDTSPQSSSRRRHRQDRKDNEEVHPVVECPVCQMGFNSVQSVENHVERCLRENQ